MKTFFRQEQLDLDQVGALSKKESSLNHTEFLVQHEELLGEMESRLKLNLVEAINTFVSAYEDDVKPPAVEKDDTATELTSALSTITGNSNKQTEKLLKMFDTICKKVERLEANQNSDSNKSRFKSSLCVVNLD